MELAELMCGYTPFGVEMTKQVMWANLDAANLEAALHLENRTQILAGTGAEGSWRPLLPSSIERTTDVLVLPGSKLEIWRGRRSRP